MWSLPWLLSFAVAQPLTYASGWRWAPAGPGPIEITDVAIHPENSDRWAVITPRGVVWWTDDAGIGWRKVLAAADPGLSSDEDLLVNVEARVGELSQDIDLPDADEFVEEDELDDLQDRIASAQDEAREAVDQLQSELEGDQWFLDDPASSSDAAARMVRPRVWFTPEGLLVVGRSDGLLWLGGSTWNRAIDAPATAFAALSDGWFVGTPTGLFLLGPAGPTLVPRFDGVAVHDLVLDQGLYVATDLGVWHSPTGGSGFVPLPASLGTAWTMRPTTDGPVVAPEALDTPLAPVQVDDPTTRPLAIGGPDALVYAPRPALETGLAVTGPVPGVREIVRRDVAMLLAASRLGPYESTDGGVTWVRIERGLDPGPTRGIAVRGDLVLLAAGGGLYRLEPIPQGQEGGGGEDIPWIPLGDLIQASLRRPALNQRLGSRWLAAAMPQVSLEYTRRDETGTHWDTNTWTTRDLQGYWFAVARLTWRPNRRPTSGAFDLDDSDVSLFVVGNDVVVDDGLSPAVMFGKVTRGGVAYREELTDQIVDLYLARQRLERERRLLVDGTVFQQLDRTLRIAEVEARLMALTGLDVGTWQPDPLP